MDMKTMIAAVLTLGLLAPAAAVRAEGGGDQGKGATAAPAPSGPGMSQPGGEGQGGGKEGKMSACKGDVEKLCKDVEPGGGRIIRCLRKNRDQVSDGCKDALKNMREERQERRGKGMSGACKGDVEKLCKDVQPGGGRIIACLKDHKDDVSDGCKQAMGRMRGKGGQGGGDEGKDSDKSGGDDEKGGGGDQSSESD